jgi:uncharacterized protein YifE (UPF0438 family)
MEKLAQILKELEQGKISADNAESKVLRLFSVSSRFSINSFESEWKKRSRMNFEWEWVEDAGCINKTECRRLVKTILKRS